MALGGVSVLYTTFGFGASGMGFFWPGNAVRGVRCREPQVRTVTNVVLDGQLSLLGACRFGRYHNAYRHVQALPAIGSGRVAYSLAGAFG